MNDVSVTQKLNDVIAIVIGSRCWQYSKQGKDGRNDHPCHSCSVKYHFLHQITFASVVCLGYRKEDSLLFPFVQVFGERLRHLIALLLQIGRYQDDERNNKNGKDSEHT
jgi:hypothetical protein